MKHVLKKALIGVAAALTLVAGGVAAGAATVDSPESQAAWEICHPPPSPFC